MSSAASSLAALLRRRAGLTVVLLVAIAATAFVAYMRARPIAVVAMPVVRGRAIDAVYATGTVEAEDRVSIKAKSTGPIVERYAREGAAVKRGDLLARIDNPAVAFDLKRGEADLSAASALAAASSPQLAALRAQADAIRAEIGIARQELGRSEQLAKTGSVASAELDRARSRVQQLEANVAANEAQQRATRIDLTANAARQAAQVKSLATRVSDTEVRSPMDGVILSKNIEIGQVVSINETLFRVGDTRSLILEVSVDEADVGRIRDGTAGAPASPVAITLYAYPKQVFRGRVFEILPDANRERKAFLTKVRFDDPPEGLRSGMSAEVNIIAREKDNALLAPSEAEQNGAVWVVRDGRVVRRAVTTGIRDLLRVEILDGLAEGDLVVTDGRDTVKEGSRVRLTVRQPEALAPMPSAGVGQTSLR